ncbi:MAG: hypothetical protein HOF21_02595 [Nitrospina sp.]|jgi:hypothetical protein|nr:hypothetical protein [Nitrospina sp.]MBT5631995.1 hypothetical protein [Nitrospina sp.]
MTTNNLNTSLKLNKVKNEFFSIKKIFGLPEIQDEGNEPFIEKLIKQQEELNRFQDISNPGVSYGFYHYFNNLKRY